jgi:hypothetical protein
MNCGSHSTANCSMTICKRRVDVVRVNLAQLLVTKDVEACERFAGHPATGREASHHVYATGRSAMASLLQVSRFDVLEGEVVSCVVSPSSHDHAGCCKNKRFLV